MTPKYGKYAPRLMWLARQKWLKDWLIEHDYAFVEAGMDEPDPTGAFPTMPFDVSRYQFSLNSESLILELLQQAHQVVRQMSEQGHPRIAAGPHTVILHSEHAWVNDQGQKIDPQSAHDPEKHGLVIAFASYQPDSAADSSVWVKLTITDPEKRLMKDLIRAWNGAELIEFLSGWSISPKE